MTDQLTGRLRSAADDAMRGVVLADPRDSATPLTPPGGQRSSRRRWLTASAVLVAAAVFGVVAWAGSSRSSDPAEPTPTTAATGTPKEQLVAAISATRSESAWQAELVGGSAETLWTFEAPDRLEQQVAGAAGEWVKESVVTGTRLFVLEDGTWSEIGQDYRTMAPFNLLDALAGSTCVGRSGDSLVTWTDPVDGCDPSTDAVPLALSAGSDLRVVELDGEGRIHHVRYGSILEVDGQRVMPSDPGSADMFVRVGATGGGDVSFTYEDVPPVTIPPDVVDRSSSEPGATTIAD